MYTPANVSSFSFWAINHLSSSELSASRSHSPRTRRRIRIGISPDADVSEWPPPHRLVRQQANFFVGARVGGAAHSSAVPPRLGERGAATWLALAVALLEEE